VVPEAEGGRVGVRAIAADPLDPVQPVTVAVTNGLSDSVRIDPRQVFAIGATGERIAPLPPGEAARLAKGHGLPGSLGGAGKGAVTGGILGAVGGAISGAIQGGMGSYETVELLLTEDPSGRVVTERASITPAE
jgi:hypothetical protein